MQHRSSFPLVVGALSVALGLLVVFALMHRAPAAPAQAPVAAEPAVSDAAYQTQMKGILSSFDASYASAKNDIGRLVLVEDTLAKVLSVRVPAGQKDFHLEIAIALNEWREGLRGDASALAAGRERYAKAKASADWLR